MRTTMKRREDSDKLSQQTLDPEIISRVKDLGYKENDIDKDIKRPHTAVSDLYQILSAKKQKLIDDEARTRSEIAAKSIKKPSKKFTVMDSASMRNKQDDSKPKSTMEQMSDIFFKIRNSPDYKASNSKIRFKQRKYIKYI
jgi:hypothetical protein